MNFLDRKVAEILNEKHRSAAKSINKQRVDPPIFEVGDDVWYLRPENSGNKLDSRWLGPAKIAGKTGQHSYHVRLNKDFVVEAHATFLKKYVNDTAVGGAVEHYFHQRTMPDPKTFPDE